MKAVVQRVSAASVTVEGKVRGSIDSGLLVYLGVARGDEETDADWIAAKTAGLRIFDDKDGTMNLSLADLRALGETTDGVTRNGAPARTGVLAVSQFTLLGDARKGRRPSWNKAADPETAKRLYEHFIEKIRTLGLLCETGVFQTRMKVQYANEGPVTILLDSRE